jgi:hypothetical protein
MKKLYIKDSLFSHAFSSSWYNKPTNFEWIRNDNEKYLILTDDSVYDINLYNNKKLYAWLLESPLIKPNSYKFIKENYHFFENIFTFDKNLLELSDKFILVPIGGCWIKEEERKIYEKNTDISIIASNKRQTEGHKLRHNVIAAFSEDYDIDIYGNGNGYKFIENKIESLKDYKFSIVIENCKSDYYFTEKIVDCFQTGTIPIYWGCPSINNFFKLDDIFIFNNLQELENILFKIKNKEIFYENYLNDVFYNYEESKKYIIADDIIYNNFLDKKTI